MWMKMKPSVKSVFLIILYFGILGSVLCLEIFSGLPNEKAFHESYIHKVDKKFESVSVNTSSGAVKGFIDENGIQTFLGIPYAQPPIGSLRWRKPEPVTYWNGIRDCSDFSSACPQIFSSGYTFPPNVTFSEDCLYLNIWAPSSASKSFAAFPVFIWIHGGGFSQGGNSELRLRGSEMAKKGNVIVVNINYRLGLLGFLGHKGLLNEDPNFPSTGNYGFLDQQLALKWVSENIPSFGGDSSQITIGGESAGGSSVALHMVAKDSFSFYRSVVMESGVPFTLVYTLTQALKAGEATQLQMNCSFSDPKRVLDCMRDVPWEQIPKYNYKWTGPCIDGYVFFENPFQSFSNGRFNKVPLIAGNVRNEGSGFVYSPIPKPLPQNYYENAIDVLFENYFIPSNLIAEQYPCSAFNASDCRVALAEAFGDFHLFCPTHFVAEYSANVAPTYFFIFNHAPSWNPLKVLGVYHSAEIDFVFSTVDYRPTHTANEDALAADVTTFWTNFINTNSPNDNEHVVYNWIKYSNENPEMLFIDYEFSSRNYTKKEKCDFWKQTYIKL